MLINLRSFSWDGERPSLSCSILQALFSASGKTLKEFSMTTLSAQIGREGIPLTSTPTRLHTLFISHAGIGADMLSIDEQAVNSMARILEANAHTLVRLTILSDILWLCSVPSFVGLRELGFVFTENFD
ncbi:hypothetical protein DICSQDRAFT_138976 [Dichomitus squalens LYAD-421 SS1]|uniref:Uncharacterized protein n=1 Tax=Dichomitus squalens (strain LYAD-421) TaxID=732165 RepID=R7SS36_DICSQ|nr:uncharacterized protein DICSQDRAFT_138976 [Dichomitus squalens LYAD-421 SS1]EJF58886.1 hypothetical protein DICSQDRAFT_138976 [Dichomitus squalens LYAD-421 SS1]